MNRHEMDIDTVAKAIEADAGEELPDLRQALKEAREKTAGRVTSPQQVLVRRARKESGLTQAAFAERIDTPVSTLRDWEQGRFTPPGSALCPLRLIAKHPELTHELSALS